MDRPVNVLLVEDSEDDELLIVRTLRAEGIDVEIRRVEDAESLKDSLESCKFDAVISDFSLPGFDGLSALGMIRSRCPDLPFIVVSGAIGEETAADFMRSGAQDFVSKSNMGRLGPALKRELEEAFTRHRRREAERESKAKSHFLASMSHELRTPLNSIIGFSGVLLGEHPGPLTKEQRKQLGMIRGAGEHLLALVNDLLDLAKIEAGRREFVAGDFLLDDAVERVVESFLAEARAKGITLRIDELQTVEMHTDRRAVEQVLLNLVSNAVKYTDEGHVCVSAFEAADGSVRVAVQDSGCGIPVSQQMAAFDEFTQVETPSRSSGTGLGLPISQQLAAALGGRISLESAVGAGSTFTFELPKRLADPDDLEESS